jgi:DNA polymerase III subunit delta
MCASHRASPAKKAAWALQRIAEMAPENDGVLTLVLLPRLDKTSKASAWFMALDAHGITVQLDPIERNALPAWIAQRLSQQQQRVREGEEGQRSLQFFADRVEGNLLAAHQEIQKLGLLYPRRRTEL